jgi:hypothetical protein
MPRINIESRLRRPLSTPRKHLLHFLFFAFKNGPDGSIPLVFHPSGNASAALRFPLGFQSEKNPLYLAADHHTGSAEMLIVRHRRFPFDDLCD